MQAAVADVARARDEFLTSGRLPTGIRVRPEIAASWRRSVQHGLTSCGVLPMELAAHTRDSQLLRAARPVIEERQQILRDLRCAITLTDADGRLLGRWVNDARLARRLDSRSVHPGYFISEQQVGTTSAGIALELGHSVLVSGPEHFADAATAMTTAGAPVRHPVTRRIAGTINIIAELIDTTPMLLAWIQEVAGAMERVLSSMVSRRERILLDAYLNVVKDTRHPVICIDDHTIISNAAAARLVGTLDQPVLWELASATARGEATSAEPILLSGGELVLASCIPVGDGASTVGAVIKIKHAAGSGRTGGGTSGCAAPSPGAAATLPGLVGSSELWRQCCRQADTGFRAGPLLLIGEPGSGKTAVARALAQSATNLHTVGPQGLRDALDAGADVVVVEGLENIERGELSTVLQSVGSHVAPGQRVIATYTADPAMTRDVPVPEDLMDWPGAVVRIPPLRDRLGDLPDLLDALTRAELGRAGGPRWLGETVQTLARLRWSQNMKSLQALVREMLSENVTAYVKVSDLPPRIQAQGTRRQLAGLETAEAMAIADALEKANGNKKLAADSLGIARSTLYRKVRALGLDLSVRNF